MRLWAEAHKSRVENDVERHKGDVGKPVPTYTYEGDDGEMVEDVDDEEEAEIRKHLTKQQLRTRKRHARRQAAASSTKGEVDAEVKALMAKAKKGSLTLADVDAMRERKDLEYKVELEHNVNLTAETTPRASGSTVEWSKSELEQVDRTLGRLQHVRDPDEAVPGPRGDDTWNYTRVNPAEHFAEVYAKAVHVPEQLHDELVVKPAEAAGKARALYEEMKRRVDALEADRTAPSRALKLANMRALLGALRADMTKAETAREQRGEEFAVMRNSVFGTDKAVKLSLGRLKAKHVSADKLEHFEERARTASTPEQVAFLESEASK